MFYIVFELHKIVHISSTRCPIEMGLDQNCDIWDYHPNSYKHVYCTLHRYEHLLKFEMYFYKKENNYVFLK